MTTLHRPDTIPEAIAALEGVVDWAVQIGSPIGYFPALHREVALAIGASVELGQFDDGPRMVRMVGEFTYRYLDALHRFRDADGPTQCWALAFDKASDESLTIVQHILMAMTAHIGLDLGVVSATVAPGSELASLRGDFEKVNGILSSLVDMDRLAVEGVSPRLRDVDLLGHVSDRLVSAAIDDARQHSWELATTLAPLTKAARDEAVAAADARVTAKARDVAHPELIVRELLRDVVRPAEDHDVAEVVARLTITPRSQEKAPT